MKSLDTVLSPAAISSTNGASLRPSSAGTIACLNLLQVGSNRWQRNGNKVQLMSIDIKLTWQLATELGPSIVPDGLIRMIFFYDAFPNGMGFPTIQNVLLDQDQLGTNLTDVFSGINLNLSNRFQVIRDIWIDTPTATIDASGNVTSSGFPDQKSFVLTHRAYSQKIRNHVAVYGTNSTPGAVGDISQGALFVICIADKDLSGFWEISGKTRVRYLDA